MTGSGPLTTPGTARAPAARLWVLGLSAAYAASAAGLALRCPQPYVRWALSGLVAIGLAAYLPLSRLLYRRPIVVRTDGRVLDLAHFGTARVGRTVPRGVWFDRHSGVGLGTALHVRTDRGRVVRVGGRGLHTPTTLCTARATRSVEIDLAAADLRRLAAVLEPDTAEEAPVTDVRVALFGRVNSGRSGCLRLGLPLLVPWVVALSVGGIDFMIENWWRPGRNEQLVAQFILAAILVTGVVAPVWITQRMRPAPVLTLELDPRGCTLRNRRGRPVAAGPPRWRRLRYSYRDLQGQMRSCPVIELVVPPRRPFTVGLLDPDHAWRGRVPPTSMPRYLVGPPDWPPLLAALRCFLRDGRADTPESGPATR